MHVRRRLLTDIKNQLKSIPDFSRRAWNQRQSPKNQYPCATVYAVSEPVSIESINEAPRSQQRALTIHISIFIKATQDDEKLECDIDNYTHLVESTIKAPIGVTDLRLLDTIFPEVFQDEEKLEVAEVVMVYMLGYDTTEFNPV
jgi:hypothetical protein